MNQRAHPSKKRPTGRVERPRRLAAPDPKWCPDRTPPLWLYNASEPPTLQTMERRAWRLHEKKTGFIDQGTSRHQQLWEPGAERATLLPWDFAFHRWRKNC